MKTSDHPSARNLPDARPSRIGLTRLGLGLWLAAAGACIGQPKPHALSGIVVSPDRTVTLHLSGSASNLITGLGGVIDRQFNTGRRAPETVPCHEPRRIPTSPSEPEPV